MRDEKSENGSIEYLENLFKSGVGIIKDAAWAIGISILFIGYPIAISVLDDRFILSKAKV